MCGNIGCAVQTLDNEEDIPEVWRAHELGKLEGPSAQHPGRAAQKTKLKRPLGGKLGEDVGESCVVEYDDECDEIDYCVPEDESATSKGDYVSLVANPERFTGYSGDGAKGVWDAIYRENCFQKTSFSTESDVSAFYSHAKNPAALDFKSVLDEAGRQQMLAQQRQDNPNTPFVSQTGFELDDECLEKRVFYRVISGMHASISTHLCWDFLNQTTGEWIPNLKCYEYRLHKHPERISNLYFNYALLTRAIAKLDQHIKKEGEYVFCTGDKNQDLVTRAKVLAVTEAASSVPQIFDESIMFTNGEGPSLKEDFRNRFRNVSRVMDCVGCDKCRLWGKLQTAGYGTALKVLFETSDETVGAPPHLKRTELVALFNTYARLSSSMHAIGKFRAMYEIEATRQASHKYREEASTLSNEPAKIKAEALISKNEESHLVLPQRAKNPHNVVVGHGGENSSGLGSDDKGFPTVTLAANDDDEGDSKPHVETPSLMKMVKREADAVMQVTKFVIRSWMKMPINL